MLLGVGPLGLRPGPCPRGGGATAGGGGRRPRPCARPARVPLAAAAAAAARPEPAEALPRRQGQQRERRGAEWCEQPGAARSGPAWRRRRRQSQWAPFARPPQGAWPQRGDPWGREAAAAAMPLLFLERFPWPSLRTYTGLSGLALIGTIVSAYRALSQPEAGPGEPEPLTAQLQPDAPAPLAAGSPRARDVAQYLLSDSLFVWVSEAAPGRARGQGGGRHVTLYPWGGVAGPGLLRRARGCGAGGRGRGGALDPPEGARRPPAAGARVAGVTPRVGWGRGRASLTRAGVGVWGPSYSIWVCLGIPVRRQTVSHNFFLFFSFFFFFF
jgi:hypothetical protein